jgi:cupin 2 domain-containing protein
MNNIYHFEGSSEYEIFEAIVSGRDLLVERIISTGQTTPAGEWYDQDRDEWVILLQGQACLSYEDGTSVEMNSGDYLLLPAHRKHRVDYTSSEPACIWLAIHGNLGVDL